MENKTKIAEIAEKEFNSYANNLHKLVNYNEKFEATFLNVKLAFIAFIGVIFTIIFDRLEKFTRTFVNTFISIVILIVALLMSELYKKTKELYDAIEKQSKKTLLVKIRHISSLKELEENEENFFNYGKEAEDILSKEDAIYQSMKRKEPIGEIIKIKEKCLFWEVKLNFIIWAILFLSIPILFLLENTKNI